MGYLGRRIGKSQNTGRSEDGADGNLGGGILDLFDHKDILQEKEILIDLLMLSQQECQQLVAYLMSLLKMVMFIDLILLLDLEIL